ncbi:hypothetical protein BC936DRAFT_147911 [Jimgerdemannia flammicorona]|uniref:Nuclear pore complex protein Nup85 n=1 Tax=Jimgerdemannia flammicorona TaxID=994334 RepID=A0A433D472_9FUNG|nr:hypothetical protein BC936DRAFT_147911 [Jimgerdemannia flammicorona]
MNQPPSGRVSASFLNPNASLLLHAGASVSFADRTATGLASLADEIEEELEYETPTLYLEDAPVPEDHVREWSERNRTWRGKLHPNGREAVVFVAGKMAKEQTGQKETAYEQDKLVYAVSWVDIPEKRRTFYNDTYSIFWSLQQLVNNAHSPNTQQNQTKSRSRSDESPAHHIRQQDLHTVSVQYRGAMQRYISTLKREIESQKPTMPHAEEEKVVFDKVLSIWHLCEIVYFPKNVGVYAAEEMMDWVNVHDPGECAREIELEPRNFFASFVLLRYDSTPDRRWRRACPLTSTAREFQILALHLQVCRNIFWQAPTILHRHHLSHYHSTPLSPYDRGILRGLGHIVQRLLKRYLENTVSPPPASIASLLNTVIKLLDTMPRSKQFVLDMDFLNRWRVWRNEVRLQASNAGLGSTGNVLENLEAASSPVQETMARLAVILHILAGDKEIIAERCDGWQEALAAMMVYCYPTTDRTDIANVLEKVYQFPRLEVDQGKVADKACVALLELDVNKAIRHCSKVDWWLVAHLTDLMDKRADNPLAPVSSPGFLSGRVEEEPGPYATDMREYFVLEYASTLVAHPTLWRAGLDYFSTCPRMGRGHLIEAVMHVPIDTDRKAQKVLEVCKFYQLDEQYRAICRILAKKRQRQERYGPAIAYYIKANEPKRVARISERLLEQYLTTGEMSYVDVIDSVGQDVTFSDRLAFLARYREFHDLYKAEKYHEAGKLLVLLLTSNAAPKSFWPILLLDSVTLLEGDIVVFNVEDTYELMRCLEEIVLSHRKADYLAYLPWWFVGPNGKKHRGAKSGGDAVSEADKAAAVIEAEKQLEVVRIALCRCLAKAIVVFGDDVM